MTFAIYFNKYVIIENMLLCYKHRNESFDEDGVLIKSENFQVY